MIRYLETFYRHRLLFFVPLVLAVAIAIGSVLVTPRTAEATARIWVYASSLNAPSPGSQFSYASPADEQAAVLKDLLSTRTFDAKVGQRGPLAAATASDLAAPHGLLSRARALLKRLVSPPAGTFQEQVDDAVYDTLSKKVTAVASGPQVVTIGFSAPSPDVATGTLQATIDQFTEEVLSQRRAQAQAVIDFLQQQVTGQQKELAAAEESVAKYQVAHPPSKTPGASDLTVLALQNIATAARQRYNGLVLELDQAKLDLASQDKAGGAGFSVIDPPTSQPTGLALPLIRAGLVGLIGGLLIALAGLYALTAADATLRRPEEVEAALGLKVAGTIARAS